MNHKLCKLSHIQLIEVLPELIRLTQASDQSVEAHLTLKEKASRELELKKPREEPSKQPYPLKPSGFGYTVASLIFTVWGVGIIIAGMATGAYMATDIGGFASIVLTLVLIAIGCIFSFLIPLVLKIKKRKHLIIETAHWEKQCLEIDKQYQAEYDAWKVNCDWCDRENKKMPEKRQKFELELAASRQHINDCLNALTSYADRYNLYYEEYAGEFEQEGNKHCYHVRELSAAFEYLKAGYADRWSDAIEYVMHDIEEEEKYQAALEAVEQARIRILESTYKDDILSTNSSKQTEELERIRKDLDNIELMKTIEYVEWTKNNS